MHAEWIETVGKLVDFIGIAITAVGGAASLLIYGGRLVTGQVRDDAYRRCRQSLGRAILLGLEFLVAGDIIRTVAIAPSFTSVGVLAIIVLIRTFLSATLTVEIEERWPWQRRPAAALDRAARAASDPAAVLGGGSPPAPYTARYAVRREPSSSPLTAVCRRACR